MKKAKMDLKLMKLPLGACCFIYLLAFLTFGCADPSDFISKESELFTKLTDPSRYNKHVRPVKNHADKTTVSLGVALINLIEVDERLGSIATQMWLRMLWQDSRLMWDPSEYENITSMRIPAEFLWQPDITLYNSARENSMMQINNIHASVYKTGSVFWVPPVITKAICDFDLTHFPFDTQTCKFKFGSWVYDGNKVDLKLYEGLKSIDMSNYIQHIEWNVIDTKAQKFTKYYPCCEEPYPDVTFNLMMRRRRTYWLYMHISPVVMLAFLVPVIFMIDHSEKQRFVFSVGLLICLTLLLSGLHWGFPTADGSMPIIVRYFVGVHVLLCLSVALSALIAFLHNKGHGSSPPSKIIKLMIVDCLGRLFCVSEEPYDKLQDSQSGVESGGGGVIAGRPSSSECQQWLLIARVLDRLCLLVILSLTVIMALAFLIH